MTGSNEGTTEEAKPLKQLHFFPSLARFAHKSQALVVLPISPRSLHSLRSVIPFASLATNLVKA